MGRRLIRELTGKQSMDQEKSWNTYSLWRVISYSPRNDPQPRNDLHFSSRRPRNDPQLFQQWNDILELWID